MNKKEQDELEKNNWYDTDTKFTLDSVELTLTLAEVYRRVNFEAELSE